MNQDDAFAAQVWKPPAHEPQEVSARPPSVVRVTAAALGSLFLPGLGQLMNRTFGRAAIIFVIWLAAWITHLSPVWTIICLYAGIDAGIVAARRR